MLRTGKVWALEETGVWELPLRDWVDTEAIPGMITEASKAAGLGKKDAMSLATATMELAGNVLIHAGFGFIRVRVIRDAPRKGVEVTVTDCGPGIDDLAEAFREGSSASGGLGVGLPGARRLVDEFHIFTEKGVGTTVVVRQYDHGTGRSGV